MLAIATYATKNYTYALKAQATLTVQALRCAGIHDFIFFFAGDGSDEVKSAVNDYASHLIPYMMRHGLSGEDAKSRCVLLTIPNLIGGENGPHGKDTNLTIAKMQNEAMSKAREYGADKFWSLESDILPEPKTLSTMLGVLNLDPGWYDVVMSTYPNAAFLGGHGRPDRWILPSFYPDERKLPKALQARVKERDAKMQALKRQQKTPSPAEMEEWRAIDREIEKCPPAANVWGLNHAKGWRRRGWLDQAYPGIGRGAVLPTEWVGMGCTLMSKRALDVANFTGYDGGCTQDLWLCWRAWHPHGLRMAVTTHTLCSHVKKKRVVIGEGCMQREVFDGLEIMYARHELGGPCDGHLRVETRPWDGI